MAGHLQREDVYSVHRVGAESPRFSGSVVGSASKANAGWLCGTGRREPSSIKLEARARARATLTSSGHCPEDPGLVTQLLASGLLYLFLPHSHYPGPVLPIFAGPSLQCGLTQGPSPNPSSTSPCKSFSVQLYEIILFIPFPFDFLSSSTRLQIP